MSRVSLINTISNINTRIDSALRLGKIGEVTDLNNERAKILAKGIADNVITYLESRVLLGGNINILC